MEKLWSAEPKAHKRNEEKPRERGAPHCGPRENPWLPLLIDGTLDRCSQKLCYGEPDGNQLFPIPKDGRFTGLGAEDVGGL